MPEIPFAHQWTIAENELLPLKDSIDGCLNSTTALNIPEFDYFLRIYPNGDKEEYRGKTWIFLHLDLKNVKKVVADYTIMIESANFSHTDSDVYEDEEPVGWGPYICSTDELFDSKKKFIVNGKFTVKLDGIFKYETENDTIPAAIEQKWIGGKLGDKFWKKDGTKDFTIITSDEKEINVHRFVLANRSEVFNTTFDLKNESTAEISDFSFSVVETGIKLIYDCNFASSLSMEELMELLQFFDNFDLPELKVDVEPYLINQISASTVVHLTNGSILTNSTKLKERCMEFLMASFKSKTPFVDIDELDKNIALQILENSQRQPDKTDGTTTSDSAVTDQKWLGGDLGDKLWNNDETKDFTITVDGKEIKAHKFVLGVQSQMFKEISKETAENEAEIIDFSFNVIETGIKLIYDCNFTTSLSMNELMELQHFFDKYQVPTLKDKVEPLLISQIFASIIVPLTNCSIQTNSFKLKEKCMEFLSVAFAAKTQLSDIKILDKDIALQILENSFYQHLETRK